MATFSVPANNRDGHERAVDGAAAETSTAIWAGNITTAPASLWIACVQFIPNIPQGSTIISATLEFAMTVTGTPALRIYGEAADDATVMDGTTSELSNKSTTTAYTNWAPTGVSGSVNVLTSLQEIVGRNGYATGSAISFLIKDNSSTAGHYVAISALEHAVATEPQLVTTWDDGSGISQVGLGMGLT